MNSYLNGLRIKLSSNSHTSLEELNSMENDLTTRIKSYQNMPKRKNTSPPILSKQNIPITESTEERKYIIM